MKVVMSDHNENLKPRTNPWIGRYRHTTDRTQLVLFWGRGQSTGVSLTSVGLTPPGYCSLSWSPDDFVEYTGAVTLYND
jgi:hypothetical protein